MTHIGKPLSGDQKVLITNYNIDRKDSGQLSTFFVPTHWELYHHGQQGEDPLCVCAGHRVSQKCLLVAVIVRIILWSVSFKRCDQDHTF